MDTKEIILQVHNCLSSDPELLTLLKLDNATPQAIEKQVLKTRQNPDLANQNVKLMIYHLASRSVNTIIERRILLVDIHAPLSIQTTTGVVFDITDRVQALLNKRNIGTVSSRKLTKLPILYDLPTWYGWYKASVPFTYYFNNK